MPPRASDLPPDGPRNCSTASDLWMMFSRIRCRKSCRLRDLRAWSLVLRVAPACSRSSRSSGETTVLAKTKSRSTALSTGTRPFPSRSHLAKTWPYTSSSAFSRLRMTKSVGTELRREWGRGVFRGVLKTVASGPLGQRGVKSPSAGSLAPIPSIGIFTPGLLLLHVSVCQSKCIDGKSSSKASSSPWRSPASSVMSSRSGQ
mmetsp:Transcript_122274/g.346661  ORF Transcript_122274/g.346661 Transcript_122274/m.346661 type:complete len:202 (-) Transcript_122274:118-723(-)